MAKRPVVLKLDTCQPVEYKESSILRALAADGQLLVEPKHDGVQLNLVVQKDGNVHFLSRAGIEFEALSLTTPKLCQLVTAYLNSPYCLYSEGYVLQGELVSLNANGTRNTAAETAGILRRKDAPVEPQHYEYVIFAILPILGILAGGTIPISRMLQNSQAQTALWGLQKTAESQWIGENTDLSNIALQVVEQHVVYALNDDGVVKDGVSIPDLMSFYQEQRDRGMEGVVAWCVNQPWHRGKKTGGWKIKPEDTYDGKVIGFFKGTAEATKDLIVGFEIELEDGHVVNADGFTDALSIEVTNKPMEYLGAAVEVSCMERFANGSLRHPKFAGFRGITQLFEKE